MEPTDEEDRARIRRHLADRAGWGFQTVGGGGTFRARCTGWTQGSVLLDSVTALLANEMFDSRCMMGRRR